MLSLLRSRKLQALKKSRLKSLRHLLPIIRWHHEKLDGTGYPDGLKGSKFPVPAQVLQLADIYDAITTDRPYHRARTRAPMSPPPLRKTSGPTSASLLEVRVRAFPTQTNSYPELTM